MKKAQNRRFLGSPTSNMFFHKLSIKKLRHTKNFGRDPPHRQFRAYFRKSAVEIFISQISLVLSPENLRKVDFFWKMNKIGCNFPRKNMKKYENLKMAFSKKGPKMSMGRVPIKIFGVSKFFYQKFVKKNFRGRGPQKSTILGLFSKIDVRNFCQLGKNVFFELPFFLKNRENAGLFWGVRPNFFSQKLIYIARSVCKN